MDAPRNLKQLWESDPPKTVRFQLRTTAVEGKEEEPMATDGHLVQPEENEMELASRRKSKCHGDR